MVEDAFFLREAEDGAQRLYGVAYHILRHRADAEDAVQQGLLKAWAARGAVREDTFRAFLYRIVINECRNIQRHRKRVSPIREVMDEMPFQPPDPDLYEAVKALPEGLRIPFLLKYVACFTEEEVACALHLPKSTVKNRLAKARHRMRNALADREVTFS